MISSLPPSLFNARDDKFIVCDKVAPRSEIIAPLIFVWMSVAFVARVSGEELRKEMEISYTFLTNSRFLR